MKEALRYLQNAKDILKKAPIEGNRYADVKYVQEACGTAYLATLKAIDEYLLNKTRKSFPSELIAKSCLPKVFTCKIILHLDDFLKFDIFIFS